MYLCYINPSEPFEEYCVSSLDQFPVEQSDTRGGGP